MLQVNLEEMAVGLQGRRKGLKFRGNLDLVLSEDFFWPNQSSKIIVLEVIDGPQFTLR